jgi:DNA-binding response OmpR family regulator
VTHAQDKSRQPTPESRGSDGSDRRPVVLLAEDDGEMRRLLVTALRRKGYRLIECADGISFVEQLRTTEERPSPDHVDLIISDIWMPGLTALEALEGLQRREDLPPMILITAFGDSSTHARARQLGAVATFDKPFDVEELLARAAELVPPN